MPMPVSVSAFAYGHPVPAGPPLVVVVVVRVPADGPQSAEPAAGEPVHLDIALALRRLHKAPLASRPASSTPTRCAASWRGWTVVRRTAPC